MVFKGQGSQKVLRNSGPNQQQLLQTDEQSGQSEYKSVRSVVCTVLKWVYCLYDCSYLGSANKELGYYLMDLIQYMAKDLRTSEPLMWERPHSWKQTIVWEVFVCCSITIYLELRGPNRD